MTHEEHDERFSLLVQRICDVLNLADELGYRDIFSEPAKMLNEQMKVAATLHSKECREDLDRCWDAMLDPRQSERVQ
jgi:hypothetical protein